jgi:hypothetical protein
MSLVTNCAHFTCFEVPTRGCSSSGNFSDGCTADRESYGKEANIHVFNWSIGCLLLIMGSEGNEQMDNVGIHVIVYVPA